MTQPLMSIEQTGSKRRGSHAGGMPQKYVLDEAGKRLLLAHYDGSSTVLDELMQRHFGPRRIPRYVVRKWAGQLGLARQKELDYLERNLHRTSLAKIAAHLGRTKTAVRLKAKRMALCKTTDGYTMRNLCLGLGCNHHRVAYWMEKGWLKGRRRQTERTEQQGGDMWYFSNAAIRDLVRAHPEEIDPRRSDWLWLVDVLLGGVSGMGPLGKENEEVEA